MFDKFSRWPKNAAGMILVLCLALALSACGEATVQGNTDGQTPSSARTPSPSQVVLAGNPTSGAATTQAGGTVGIGTNGSNATAGSDGTRIEGTAGSGLKSGSTSTAGGGAANTGGQATATAGPGGAGGAGAGSPSPGATNAAGGQAQSTPTAGSGNLKNFSPTQSAGGVPVYQGAEKINIPEDKLGQVIQGYDNLKNNINSGQFTFYKLAGNSTGTPVAGGNQTPYGIRVSEFYRSELQSQGWTDRTGLLTITKELSGVSFFGTAPSFFTKGDQGLFVGASPPLTADNITQAGLGDLFKPGDVAIMTASGTPKIKIQ